MLPLSHDEVVHGKGSLLGKMPGDDWQRHANLRLLLRLERHDAGQKLLFMGGELAPREWNRSPRTRLGPSANPATPAAPVADLNPFTATCLPCTASGTSPLG